MKYYRTMLDIFENFMIAYVDTATRSFALNNMYSEISLALRCEAIGMDDAGILKISTEDFIKDYESWRNFFTKAEVITGHLKDFKEKIGRIEQIKGSNIASINIGNSGRV